MKYAAFSFFLVAITSTVIAQKSSTGAAKPLPRIAVAGIAIESSTFSPAHTDEAAFHAQYGKELLTRYNFLATDSPTYQRAVWFPALGGHSLPGGAVTHEAYESLV